MVRKFLKGQSTAEYAVLLAIVAASLIAMQVYIKRGIQGRIRDLADQVSTSHYEPTRTTSQYTVTQSGAIVQQYHQGIARTYQDPNADLDGDGLPDAPESLPDEVERSGYEETSSEEQ